jgi:deoxyribose-phosphate aldolase
MGVTNIGVLPYSVNTAKSAVSNPELINISVPLDLPYGLSDTKTRNFMVSQACKSKINTIDLFIPTKILSNRKYDKLREDIRSNLEICKENNINLRYILEYRVFSHEILAKVCAIFVDLGINTIIPASGFMIDDINDNLIACNYLHTKTGIRTICNGNIYSSKHANLVRNSGLYGLRLHYLNSIGILNENKYTE